VAGGVTAQLQGHVAIVTGGGRGFGKAIATRLARCGQMCVDLASGRFDGLSGSYLTPQDDFAALLERRK
jgi:NAD(P)-dependent dehydrogenase (short-subunit alcohol dehydrogenase family)